MACLSKTFPGADPVQKAARGAGQGFANPPFGRSFRFDQQYIRMRGKDGCGGATGGPSPGDHDIMVRRRHDLRSSGLRGEAIGESIHKLDI
jgi:hypothetical protein